MTKIINLTNQEILLEGFGVIEIKEGLSGEWQIDLFPRGSENDRTKIQLETTFSSTGDKYFEYPKQNKDRTNEIYGETLTKDKL